MINTKNNNTDENPLEVKIMNVLTNNKFCRKKPSEWGKNRIKETIKSFTENNKPIRLVVLFGGYKNPSTELFSPDLAEINTLQRLNILISNLCAVYSYGAELYIVTTGKKGEIANEIPSQETIAYEEQLCEITKNFAGIKIIPIGNLYEKFFNNGNMEKIVMEGKRQAESWKDDKDLTEKIEIARRHNPLLAKNGEESIKKALGSALIYSSLSSREPEMLVKEFGKFIKLSFRMGGEEKAISLFTCRKGMQKQPWNNKCKGCQHEQECLAGSKSSKILYI